jgi:threonylcarbamoyladenosine tRNA methylthiotransferase MtaB
MVRVAVVTHGCRLNRADTDAMAGKLRAEGHEIVRGFEGAEAIVVNTCTITHDADADARQLLRKLQREHPAARVVATGCWATAQPALARELGASAVLGNADKSRIAEAVGAHDFVAVSSLRRPRSSELVAAAPEFRSRALLKVQDGCNYRCAFCIVPSVRGPSRSSTVAEVIAQLHHLVAGGAPEVVMTGVHLGTWGRDLRPRIRLVDLVEGLLPHLGAARLRLSSLDPHEVDDDLLDLFAAHPGQLCRHLHLPVQSVDDGVLRQMRRGHTAAAFADVVRRAVARVPAMAIGTDVIAGFPTEDADAAARTHDRLAALPLSYLHVFPYSRRESTPAAQLADAVGEPARRQRAARLRALSRQFAARFRQDQANTVVDVVTHVRPDAAGHLVGVTDNYLRVSVREPVPAGRRVRVRLDDTARVATPLTP